MKKMTKMERFLRELFPNPCYTGRSAIRRVSKMTLARAWKDAQAKELRSVLSALNVRPPKGLRCYCAEGDEHFHFGATADEIRNGLRGKIPAKVRAAYAKA